MATDVSERARGLILAHALAMVLWPVAFLLPYYFRATGRAGFTMAVALTAMAEPAALQAVRRVHLTPSFTTGNSR